MKTKKIEEFLQNSDDTLAVGTAQLWASSEKGLLFEITIDFVGSLVLSKKNLEDLSDVLEEFKKKIL